MDGDGCAGCFLWIIFFVIAYIFLHLFIGAFWIALLVTVGFMAIAGILRAILLGITAASKRKNK